jgi:hypothetical protein
MFPSLSSLAPHQSPGGIPHSTRDQKWIDIQMMTSVGPPSIYPPTVIDTLLLGSALQAERRIPDNHHDVRHMQRPSELVC